jgi:hypothetical protein
MAKQPRPADNYYGVEPVVDMKLVRKILREAMKDPLYINAVYIPEVKPCKS